MAHRNQAWHRRVQGATTWPAGARATGRGDNARARRTPPPAPGLGGAVATLACAVAVVIAVVAMTSLGPATHKPTLARSPTVLTGRIPATERALIARLSVLRRRQRRSDRLPRWAVAQVERPACADCLSVARVIPGLTRLLTTIRAPRGAGRLDSGSERVYLVVGTGTGPFPGAGGNAVRAAQPASLRSVHAILIGIDRRAGRRIDPLLDPALPPAGRVGLWPAEILMTASNVGLIPDGVTRVKWVFDGWGERRSTTYPSVHGNLAISKAIPGEYPLRSATWYGARGQVVAYFSDGYWIDRQNRFRANVSAVLGASSHEPVAVALQRAFRILRRSPRQAFAAGGISADLAVKLFEGTPRYELDVARAAFVPFRRGVAPDGTRLGVWVIPGSRGVCIATGAADGAALRRLRCASLQTASSGALFLTVGRRGRRETLVGLAPDATETVEAGAPAGRRLHARVFDNVWSMTLPAVHGRLLLIDAAGRRIRIRR